MRVAKMKMNLQECNLGFYTVQNREVCRSVKNCCRNIYESLGEFEWGNFVNLLN